MEASVAGADAGQTADAGTQDSGQEGQEQQAQQQQGQIPQEVVERLDELSGFRDDLQPLLSALQAPPEDAPEGEQEPGWDQYYDDETGEFDPQAFDTQVEQRARQIAQEQMGPLADQFEQMQQRMLDQEFDALGEDYPQLQDETFMREFVPDLQAAAAEYAQELGLEPDVLARNPNFIEDQYLARLARTNAQQGAPAGDQQGVTLEGGSGQPGTPAKDDTLDRWDRDIQQNLGSGPWGRNLLSG